MWPDALGPGAALSGSASDGAASRAPGAWMRGRLSPFSRLLVTLLPHPAPEEEAAALWR